MDARSLSSAENVISSALSSAGAAVVSSATESSAIALDSSSIESHSPIIWNISSFVVGLILLIPNWIISILHITVNITLSLKWIIVAAVFISGVGMSIVRYKYLTVYSRLPEEPERQEPKLDVFLETANKKKDSRFPNFLDGFLSAIKIFGYLDKNVFHELTRNMTTQKLDSDETFLIDEAKGFSIVVEGSVDVYCKVGPISRDSGISEGDPGELRESLIIEGVRYQLLNSIKSGATLSSLISILKILTSVIEDPTETNGDPMSQQNLEFHTKTSGIASLGGGLNIPAADSPALSNFELDRLTPPPPSSQSQNDKTQVTSQEEEAAEAMPSLLARAATNATIAIIPVEAFARIVEKHPLSVSHIVQMIMARLHRVTFQTAHSYLGLTNEIYQTEINLNSAAKYELPSYLHDGMIQKLNEQLNAMGGFSKTATATATTSSTAGEARSSSPRSPLHGHSTGIQSGKLSSSIEQPSSRSRSHISSALSPKSSSAMFSDDGSDEGYITMPRYSTKKKSSRPGPLKNMKSNKSRNITLNSRNSSNPGDLFSNVPLSRIEMTYQPLADSSVDQKELLARTFSAEEETEDSSVRIAITESIFKLLGINKESLEISAITSSETEPGSPALGGINNSLAIQNINNLLGSQNSKRRFSSNSSALYPVLGFNATSTASIVSDEDAYSTNSERRRRLDFDTLKKELSEKLQVMLIKKNIKIVEQNQRTPGLYYVVDGLLQVSHKKANEQETKLYTVKPGGIAGYLGTFIGNNSFIEVSTLTDAYVGFISKDDMERFIEKNYMLQLIIARNTVKFMDKNLLLMDLAVEWVQTQAGESLYDQGDSANGIYMVLNGRFRSVHESNPVSSTDFESSEENKISVLSEHGQGESLGEVEVLTASERPTSMVAVRDSETARIPRTLFEILSLSKPSIMIKVTRIVAHKMKENTENALLDQQTSHKNPTISALPSAYNSGTYRKSTNYRTITILPVRQGLPVMEFAQKLGAAFKACDRKVIVLNQASTLTHLGRHAFDKLAKLKQSGFFADLEEKFQTVIYVADTPVSSKWTQTAISQGDCILLLADADASPDVGDYERLLVKTKTTARTELILLHPERYVKPGQTSKWLKSRIWVHSHHHVQMEIKSFAIEAAATDLHSVFSLAARSRNLMRTSQAKIATIRSKVGNIIKDDILKMIPALDTTRNYYPASQDYKSDFMRLARILSGNAVALVLGGGGSRGLSHIGIIKALEEKGIPIDMIGGTSIGAFVGGLYAKDYDLVPIYGRSKQFAGRVASFWRMATDLTYPVTSYTTGHEFNRGIWKAFGDSRIEDFWIKFFTNSTNITNSVMEVHSSGYAWRYIRASMSLAGLLPPITDNGSMLLDGGYIDNLPVEEMKNRGANIIFAVDVGSVDDRTPQNYGDCLSGLWVILNRWNPFSSFPNVPTMAEIQLRLTYVASVNALEKAKRTSGVCYLRPPIDGYSTLDFGKFDEIYNVGSAYGEMALEQLEEKGVIAEVKGITRDIKEHARKAMQRRNSI